VWSGADAKLSPRREGENLGRRSKVTLTPLYCGRRYLARRRGRRCTCRRGGGRRGAATGS
jgi:hypothetical protein